MKLKQILKSDIFKKSIVKTWLVSYIATLLIPIVFLSSFYFLSNNITEKNIDYQNELMISSVTQNINTILSDNTSYINFVSHSPSFLSCLNLSSYSLGSEYYTFLSLSKEISKYNQNIAAKNRFYIYFNNLDLIVSDNGVYPPKSFFDTLSDNSSEYSDWFNSISTGRDNFVRLTGSDGKSLLLSIYRFPSGPKQSTATLITNINENAIALNIQDKINFEYAVLDQNEKIAISSFNIDNKLLEALRLADNDDTIRLNDKKFDATAKYLDNNYKLVCLFEHSRYSKNINTLNMTCVAVIILTALLGIVVISRYIKIQYSPIENILDTLRDTVGSDNLANEYDVVKYSIEKMQSENRSATSKLDEQNRIITNEFLTKLLTSNALSDKVIENNLKIHNIEFGGNAFAVVNCIVDSYDSLFDDMPPDTDETKKLDTILFAVKNVCEEYAKEVLQIEVHTVNLDSSICFIISFPAEKCDEKYNKTIEICEFLCDFFEQKLTVFLKLSVSGSVIGANNLSLAYIRTKSTLSFNEHKNAPCVVTYVDAKQNEKGLLAEYRYTAEIEQRLINFVEIGNLNAALSIISELFPQSPNNDTTFLQLAKTKACNIMSIVGDLLGRKGNTDILPTSMDDILRRIISIEDVEEIISYMTDILRLITESFANNKANRISDSILDCIEENYSDINLGVSSIADMLGMSRSYVSTKFKEQFGIGINEYINKYRIKKAKELLNTADHNLNTISRMVGYSDSRTFIRIFKKYEDITPGKYRSSL